MQDVAGDVCILVLLDGFDRAVSSGRLTRNLWDGLRELASLPSVRFVTSTRNTLRELIRTAESAASDFWNIFDPNPIRLGPFSEADQALIAESAGMRLGTGALSELANWSGGFPPLFLGILNEAITSEVAEIDNEAVNRLAEGSMEALDGVLNEIWDDCPEGARGLLVTLIGEGPKRDTGRLERRLLIERGLAQERSGEVRASCRLMCLHRENLEQDVGSLRRLFGVPADYEANARSMLDLRLMQASQVDEDLRQYVESCIQEAVRRPDACLYNLRGILDRALALIWAKELPNGEIPSHMRQHWESSGQDDQLRLVRVPEDRRRQIRLLQLLTGSAPGITAHASYVSKNTYTLITSLHGYANLGQHHEGTEVCATVAIVATHAAVELAHLLAAELG